jgi:flotillin
MTPPLNEFKIFESAAINLKGVNIMEALGGIALLVLFFVLITVLVVYLSRIRTIGPNEVLIISGRKRITVNSVTGEKEEQSYRVVKAGRAFIWPVIERVDVLSLELLTIEISIDDVYTAQGSPSAWTAWPRSRSPATTSASAPPPSASSPRAGPSFRKSPMKPWPGTCAPSSAR